MNADIWIVIRGRKYGYQSWALGSIRATKKKPAIASNEIAIRLKLEIPNAVFDEPVFEASISLPEPSINMPNKAEIADGISEAMSRNMGFKVKVSMEEDHAEQASEKIQ
jgi:hypothetical protein